jgi:hypothetical protein
MALVAINRLVGVYFPHRMDLFSTSRSWMMVGCTWMISMGLMLLPLTEIWGQLGYEPLTFSCTIMEKNGSSPMTFLLIFGFVCPFLSIAIGYGLICYRVKYTGDLVRKAGNYLISETTRPTSVVNIKLANILNKIVFFEWQIMIHKSQSEN